jgi:beta-lactamase regulating signal transducer with metallopeptidase domain
VSLAALVGLLVLPATTGVLLSEHVWSERPETHLHPAQAGPDSVSSIAALPSTAAQATGTGVGASWVESVHAWLQPALPWAVLAWGLGVMILAVRWAGGAWRVRRLRRASRPAPNPWREQLERLATRMGLKGSIALRQSDRIESPMVSGWWRPVVLVPAGLLSGFPPRQVEALLLHELAHVRRHDVLVGYLQAVVETLLFFHPATW